MTEVLAPEVLTGLGAVSRVSRALVGPGDLGELAAAALAEMRDALGLDAAAFYLPDADGQPVLRRYVGEAHAAAELAFDAEAWRLAVVGGAPIVLREPASWLVANPFTPPAADWLILPLATDERAGASAGRWPPRSMTGSRSTWRSRCASWPGRRTTRRAASACASASPRPTGSSARGCAT